MRNSVTVVAVRHWDTENHELPDPNAPLAPDAELVVVGHRADLERFRRGAEGS